MIRRLAAVVMAVAMLHSSATAGDAACVGHEAMAAGHVTESPAGTHRQMSAHDAHAVGATAERAPGPLCDGSVPPSCCGVLAGCSTIGLASHASPADAAQPDAAPAHVMRVDVPASRRAAPEPPPPKR